MLYHADHGAYTGTHGIPEKAPGICSEAVCRVPMIWRVPGVTLGGRLSDALVENVDVAPTFCGIAGAPAMASVDGRDLCGVLKGEQAGVREMAVTENAWSKAVRLGDWRFVHYQREMFNGEDVGELYDMAADPEETRNLYHDPAMQGVVNDLRRRLLEWLIGTTRVVTTWPTDGSRFPYNYGTAEDGKQGNHVGPRALIKAGWPTYL